MNFTKSKLCRRKLILDFFDVQCLPKEPLHLCNNCSLECTVLCKSNASQFRRISWLFLAFWQNFAHSEIAAINRRNFVTPIVSFRAINRDARTFEASFRAIFCAPRNFAAIFRANFRFVCQFSSISGQYFAAFEIPLEINHLCSAVVCVKSSCDPSAYAVSINWTNFR